MNYSEDKKITEVTKQEYVDGIRKIIADREQKANEIRKQYIRDIKKNPQKYRKDFREMLGWPLTEKSRQAKLMNNIFLSNEGDFSIYRLQFEVMDGFIMTGLLLKKNDDKTRPMIIAMHGGLGTPELVSGLYGDTANYNRMVERIIKNNVNVFVPQILLWGTEEYGVNYDRQELDMKLKRVGSSITALEIFGIEQIIDYFDKLSYVSDFGMIGLSYGGMYTLFVSALDERIKASISSCFFNDRNNTYGWSDWHWKNSAYKFNDAEIASMVYPRKLIIHIGIEDSFFKYEYALSQYEVLKEILGNDNTIEFIGFDGVHEFSKENEEDIERVISILH